jgi:deoxyribonucleoside regulator
MSKVQWNAGCGLILIGFKDVTRKKRTMKITDDRKTLLEVARLYYEEEITKSEIAKSRGVSNTQVGRLLKEAHERGIVQIKFHPPLLEELGFQLIRRFDLRKAIVIPSVPNMRKNYEFQRRLWGEAAADYFEETVKPGMKVGISGGYTVHEMISALPVRDRRIKIFPTAIIGRGPIIEHLDPVVLVTLLWSKSGRASETAYYVTVPPFERGSSVETVQRENKLLLKRQKVRTVYEGMKEVDIIFGSIGSVEVPKEYSAHTHHTTIRLLEEIGVTETRLRSEGAVGDINYSFFNENGNTKASWDFFLTLDVEHLRRMASLPKKDVVIMAGVYKVVPLKAVLKGRLCNVLITDEQTAIELLG